LGNRADNLQQAGWLKVGLHRDLSYDLRCRCVSQRKSTPIIRVDEKPAAFVELQSPIRASLKSFRVGLNQSDRKHEVSVATV
jgi:hypothetical protein